VALAVADPPPSATTSRRRHGCAPWSPFLAGLFVLAVLAAGYALLRDPLAAIGGNGNKTDTSRKPSATQPAYERVDRPAWMPAGWQLTVQQTASKLWVTRDEDEGGRCEVTDDTLLVTRQDGASLVGCTIEPTSSPLDRTFYDVAVEAEVTVTEGCVGLWTRTGGKGYLLAVCDGYLALHRLDGNVDTPLGRWPIGYRRGRRSGC
jgi:hypothetical protein